jgi:hypothetical protein
MSVGRIAPLSGIVFVALAAVSLAVLGGNTPGVNDSSATIELFYDLHNSKNQLAARLLAISVGFLAVFAASCLPFLRRSSYAWTALFFAGAVVAAAGFLVAAWTRLALADGAHHTIDPIALQALNTLDANDYQALGIGLGIMLVGGGAALLNATGALRVLGVVGIVLGVLNFTPLGLASFLGSFVWVVALSWMLFQRPDAFAAEARPAA